MSLLTDDVLIDISADDNLSNSADLQDFTLSGLMVPAGMTSTTITFEVSVDNSTFLVLHDSANAAVSLTIDSNARAFKLNPQDFAAWRYIKIATGSGEGSDRTLTLVGVLAANRD